MRLHSRALGLRGRLGVLKLGIVGVLLALLMVVIAGCGDKSPTTTRESPGTGAQTQQATTPTATPTPQLPGPITAMPAPESYRLDLGDGVVVAFVEGLSPEYSGRVAYVTHVPSGSQLVLDRYGQVVDRHDGREDGPDRLDGVLADDVAMEHIIERLQSDEDARPHESAADWVHSVQCWQSAQVGQIRTREDYYYEELRVSSLRVLL